MNGKGVYFTSDLSLSSIKPIVAFYILASISQL
jgi:hypothetical protein